MTILRRAAKKLSGSGGFSMVELLLTLVIMVMLTGLVTTSLKLAFDTAGASVDRANAETLLSTGINLLKDELGTATEITADLNTVSYKNGRTGNYSTLFLKTETGITGIAVKDYKKQKITEEGSITDDTVYNERFLVTRTAETAGLALVFDSVDADSAAGTFTITGLKVTKDSKELASMSPVVIRAGGR